MAVTDFSAQTQEKLTLWERSLWKQARNRMFLTRFLGDDSNSLVQRITTLKKDKKGARAVITLLADLVGDGIAGDRQLEGNEEAMQTFDKVIRIDQLRHAVRNMGRMSDQKVVVEFRANARDQLSNWHAQRHDQLGFLTASGVPYTVQNNGAPRVGSDLINLEFAPDVKPITPYRRLRWDRGAGAISAATLVSNASTGDVAPEDTPCWEMFVQAKAYAKTHKIRGVRVGGRETYHAFLSPLAMAKLKLDPTYMLNLRHAQQKGDGNALFDGGSVQIDDLYIHEYENVFNTSGASGSVVIPFGGPTGSKWGAAGDVDGCQILFCGAQALAYADIGNPYWDEEGFDYQNSQGISVGKIFGFLNPTFRSPVTGSEENHGLMSIYVAQ